MARHCLLLIGFTFASIILFAAESPYQTGKIVDIQQKVKSRVLYYQVDTPITQDDPYYEISVQVNDVVYTGDYTPRHAADSLPADWKAGADIHIRLEKHYIFLQRSEGRELQLTLLKHASASAMKPAGQDADTPKK
jgi:hypothetical protein